MTQHSLANHQERRHGLDSRILFLANQVWYSSFVYFLPGNRQVLFFQSICGWHSIIQIIGDCYLLHQMHKAMLLEIMLQSVGTFFNAGVVRHKALRENRGDSQLQ